MPRSREESFWRTVFGDEGAVKFRVIAGAAGLLAFEKAEDCIGDARVELRVGVVEPVRFRLLVLQLGVVSAAPSFSSPFPNNPDRKLGLRVAAPNWDLVESKLAAPIPDR